LKPTVAFLLHREIPNLCSVTIVIAIVTTMSKSSVRSSLLREASLPADVGHVNMQLERPVANQEAGWTSGGTNDETNNNNQQNEMNELGWGTGEGLDESLDAAASTPLHFLPRVTHRPGHDDDSSMSLSSTVVGPGATAGGTHPSYIPLLPSASSTAGSGSMSIHSSGLSSSTSDHDKLLTVLSNYLALSQIELARTVMEQLFVAAPEKLIRALRALVFTNIPAAWLFSRAVPSAGHVSWLAYIEYKKLFVRVFGEHGSTALTTLQSQQVHLQKMQKSLEQEEEKMNKFLPPPPPHAPMAQSIQGTMNSFSSTMTLPPPPPPPRPPIAGTISSNHPQQHTIGVGSTLGGSGVGGGAGGNNSRLIPRHLLPKVSNTLINPFGFITHDRLTVRVIEGEYLRMPYGREGMSAAQVRFFPQIRMENQCLNGHLVIPGNAGMKSSGASSPTTNLNHTFHTTVWYADSNLIIKIYACVAVSSNTSPANHAVGAPTTVRHVVCAGEVSLPLLQIRNKVKYHIWLPLRAPSDTGALVPIGGSGSSSSSGSSGGGSGGGSFGRIRLKLVWWSSGLVNAGDFAPKTRWLLETDLLIANAVVNHRATPGRKMLSMEVVEELRNFVRKCWNAQVVKQRRIMAQQSETLINSVEGVLSQQQQQRRPGSGGDMDDDDDDIPPPPPPPASSAAVSTGLAMLFGKSSAPSDSTSLVPSSTAASSSSSSSTFASSTWSSSVTAALSSGGNHNHTTVTDAQVDIEIPVLSDEVFRHLRKLIRHVPAVGHALAAQLCLVSGGSSVAPTPAAGPTSGTSPSPSAGHDDTSDQVLLFQHLYVQLLGEMVLRKEFGRATEALVHVCKDIFANIHLPHDTPQPDLSLSGVLDLDKEGNDGEEKEEESKAGAEDNESSPKPKSKSSRSSRGLSPSVQMVDAIFLLFVVFIHQGYNKTLEKVAMQLMNGNVVVEDDGHMRAGGSGDDEDTKSLRLHPDVSRRSLRKIRYPFLIKHGRPIEYKGKALDYPGASIRVVIQHNKRAPGEDVHDRHSQAQQTQQTYRHPDDEDDEHASSDEDDSDEDDEDDPSWGLPTVGAIDSSELVDMDANLDPDAVDAYNLILDRKTKVYSALLASCSNASLDMASLVSGSMLVSSISRHQSDSSEDDDGAPEGGAGSLSSECLLHRFMLVEDLYCRALADSFGPFPTFFENLLGNHIDRRPFEETKIERIPPPPPPEVIVEPQPPPPQPTSDIILDEFLVLDSVDDPTFLHAFWRYYSNYVRIRPGGHLFEFPVQVALGIIRLNQWNKVSLLLKPFHKLRTLVVLLAWDEYKDDYGKRREIVIRLWRIQRMHGARARRERRMRLKASTATKEETIRKLKNMNLDSLVDEKGKDKDIDEEDDDLDEDEQGYFDDDSEGVVEDSSDEDDGDEYDDDEEDDEYEDEEDDEEDASDDGDDGETSSVPPPPPPPGSTSGNRRRRRRRRSSLTSGYHPRSDGRVPSERKLVQWVDRLDVFVLWVDTLINLHPELKVLPKKDQLSLSNQLVDDLTKHSILYAFQRWIPSLDKPDPLLRLVDPHQSEEMAHDFHVLRSFYALRDCLEIMQRSDAQMNAEMLREEGEDEDVDEMPPPPPPPPPPPSESGASPVPSSSTEPFDSFLHSRLESIAIHLKTMVDPVVQVGALEKIFALLFISRKGWERFQRAQQEGGNIDMGDVDEDSEFDDDEDDGDEEDESNPSSAPRKKSHHRSYFHLRGRLIGDLLHFLKTTIDELLIRVEKQEKDKMEERQRRREEEAKMKERDRYRTREEEEEEEDALPPSHPLNALSLFPPSSIVHRLRFLQSKVLEGLWRMTIITQSMKVSRPTLHHLVSTLSSLSVFFLQRDLTKEAHLHPPFSKMDFVTTIAQPFLRQHIAAARIVADTVSWQNMCLAIQQMEVEGRRKEVAKFIQNQIENFHQKPKNQATIVEEENDNDDEEEDEAEMKSSNNDDDDDPSSTALPFSALKLHQHLQSYFLYMDSALTFAHLLSEYEYVTLVSRARDHAKTVVEKLEARARRARKLYEKEIRRQRREEEKEEGKEHADDEHESEEDDEEDDLSADDEIEDEASESINIDLVRFFLSYSERRVLLSSHHLVKSVKSGGSETFHPFSLDDASQCEAILPGGSSEGMRAERSRIFGFESSPASIYTRWMNMHGAQNEEMNKTLATSSPSDPTRVADRAALTPYLQRYYDYLKVVNPVDPVAKLMRDPWSGATGVKMLEYLARHSIHTRAAHNNAPLSFVSRFTHRHSSDFNPFACTALQILPALAAVRYVLRAERNVEAGAAANNVPKMLRKKRAGSDDMEHEEEKEKMRSEEDDGSVDEDDEEEDGEEEEKDAFTVVSQLARHHSQFNPTFQRWVDWRLSLYETLHAFTAHAKSIPFVFKDALNIGSLTARSNAGARGNSGSNHHPLSSVADLVSFARDCFGVEVVGKDQQAIERMVTVYVDTFEHLDAVWKEELAEKEKLKAKEKKHKSKGDMDTDAEDAASNDPYRSFLFQTKLSVLLICDTHMDHPSNPRCVELVDRLLATLITDAACPSPLRARLLLRVTDIVATSVWTLSYLHEWYDVDLCTDVLLKCMAGLSAIEINEQAGDEDELATSASSATKGADAHGPDGPARKGKDPKERQFDHRHRFDEYESSDEEDIEEEEDFGLDDSDDEDEDIDAGVMHRGNRAFDLDGDGRGGRATSHKKHATSSSSASTTNPSSTTGASTFRSKHSLLAETDRATYARSIGELRSSIEFKYHVILIYKQLVELDEGAIRERMITQPHSTTINNASSPTSPSSSSSTTDDAHLFPSWQSLESSCNTDLTRVILLLIQHRLVSIAQKLYVLYKTYSKLYPAAAAAAASRKPGTRPSAEELEVEAYHREQERRIDAHLTNQLESASLAELMSASSTTSDRIFAIKRIQALPVDRLYDVAEGILRYLDSSHSRYVIAQLLAQFLEQQSREIQAGGEKAIMAAQAAAQINKQVAETILGSASTAAGGIRHTATAAGGVGGAAAATAAPGTAAYAAAMTGGHHHKQQHVTTSILTGTMLQSSLDPSSSSDADAISSPSLSSLSTSSPLLRQRFYYSLSIEKERWFVQVHHATKMLVCLPEDVQSRYAHLYADPLAIMTELLKVGSVVLLRKLLPLFIDYCALTASIDDAFFFLLNFASRLLTFGLEELALDKEVGFGVMDVCVDYGQGSKVAKMALIMVEVLSGKLTTHAHPFMLLHQLTAILIYLGRRVVYGPYGLDARDPANTTLFKQYELYVRMACGPHVDTREPTYMDAQAKTGGSRMKETAAATMQMANGAAAGGAAGTNTTFEPDMKPMPVFDDVESKMAWEQSTCESSLPLLYALVSSPLVPSASLISSLPLSDLPTPGALLSRLLGRSFSIADLYRSDRCAAIRDRLIDCDAKKLAKRVWKECEHRPGHEFDAYARARIRATQREREAARERERGRL